MQYHNLPPLGLFKTFEVAARRMSFTRAAEELCVTQGAVSRQIRTLEEQLGIPLFKRLHRSIDLTPKGRELQQTITSSLSELITCVQEIRGATDFPQLTVAASVSFAYFWLMPRLERFSQECPNIDLRILASDQLMDLSRDGVDIAIQYGNGEWPGLQSSLLFGEMVYPVCSPAFLESHPEINQASDLLSQTLLHIDCGDNIWVGVDWQIWLARHDVTASPERRGIRMNSYPMIIQAAQSGRGVALGWSYIVDTMIEDGLLVKPLDLSLKTQKGYYLTSSELTTENVVANEFKQWILNEISFENSATIQTLSSITPAHATHEE